ncbi:MAG: ABC transporter substrate-binding protein, partial [Acidimicrobiia bacterium]
MTNKRWTPIVAMLAVLSMVAAACGTPGGGDTTTTADSGATTTAGDGDSTTTAGGDETTTTGGTGTTTGGGEGDPLRIGVVVPLTGGLASPGTDMKDGFDLFWANHPTEIAGRTVEYRVEDTGGVPETALQLADELVQNYGAEIIVGPLLANVTLALADRLKDNPDVIFVVPVGSADDLTQRLRDDYPNFIRAGGWTSSQPTHVLGDWAAKQGYETAATICTDYAFGHEMCGGFTQVFTDEGGVVDPANQLWNPLGAQDFATYITQLQGMGTDMVFGLQVGGSAGDFLSSWSDFGLKDQIPLLGGEVITDVSSIRNLDPSIVEGIISSGHWASGRDAPETQELVDLSLAATDKIPSYYLAATWTAAQYITAAVE